MIAAIQPRKLGISREEIGPAFKRSRDFNADLVGPFHDRRTRIRREDIGPELGAGKSAAHVHHEADRLVPLDWPFSRIGKDDVERRPNVRRPGTVLRCHRSDRSPESPCSWPSGSSANPSQRLGRSGAGRFAAEASDLPAKPDDQIGGCLNAPLEILRRRAPVLRNIACAIEIDKEVVVDDPQHLQVVTPRQIDSLFDKLLGRQGIPFASVDSCVRAVGAVERARQAGRVHCPAPAAQPLVSIEVGQVIGLRWHIRQRPERTLRGKNELAFAFEADAGDKVGRRTVLDMLTSSSSESSPCPRTT